MAGDTGGRKGTKEEERKDAKEEESRGNWSRVGAALRDSSGIGHRASGIRHPPSAIRHQLTQNSESIRTPGRARAR